MSGSLISDLDDPRLEPYRGIRFKNWTEHSGIFIAEGPLLVEQLLGSDFLCCSVLLDEKFIEHYAELVGPEVEQLIVKHELVERLVGFQFHRGVLGCGRRKEILSAQLQLPKMHWDETLVALVGVQDPENLGSILRTSAALGVRHVLLGPGTADPLGRRTLRVSMGTALRLRFYRAPELLADIAWLQAYRSVRCLASSLSANAIPMEQFQREGPVLLLFGNERHGLPHELQAAADHCIRIDMKLQVDSLNVSVAAGILLHYVSRLAAGPASLDVPPSQRDH